MDISNVFYQPLAELTWALVQYDRTDFEEIGDSLEAIKDYIQEVLLGFCGCGESEANLHFIRRGLEHIKEKSPDGAGPEWYEGWRKRGVEIFGTEASRWFFFYWADCLGLVDHGGCLPGWLSPIGETLLEVLQMVKVREEAADGEPYVLL